MDDVFKIILDSTVANLEKQLLNLFACQDVMGQANTALADDDTNQTLLDNRLVAATSLQYSTAQLNGIDIVPSDLFQNFKSLEESTIR